MHMMSKKELYSEDLWTVKRSRTSTEVLTANGEVHTHEEAQVFVHVSSQSVTVQLLEETPAVLSLGKLCKDHGYCCEWVSGQEPRLTENGKVLSARQSILYLLSFQGYPPILEANRLQHRHHKNRWDRRHLSHLETERKASSSSDSVLGRSDETSSGKLGQESWENDKKDKNDPFAHISQDSHCMKVQSKSWKHSAHSHFPNTEIAKFACQPK